MFSWLKRKVSSPSELICSLGKGGMIEMMAAGVYSAAGRQDAMTFRQL